MANNNFKPFAAAAGANVMAQADYEALAALLTGFQSGTAQSAQLNKVWRQSSIMAAVLAQFIVDRSGKDAIDDGTTATLLANLKLSAASLNGDSTQTFSVASGTQGHHAARLEQTGFQNIAVYRRIGGVVNVSVNGGAFTTVGASSFVVPVSGRFKARVWGAGGGGGAGVTSAAATGGGGGGYAEGVFVATPGSSQPITVGAGGAGGTGSGNGVAGGSSSVGSLISATGGGGGVGSASGAASGNSVAGGTGSGGSFNVTGEGPASAYTVGSSLMASGGGGAFGAAPSAISIGSATAAIFPGGAGGGGANNNVGQSGADGVVIIEY